MKKKRASLSKPAKRAKRAKRKRSTVLDICEESGCVQVLKLPSIPGNSKLSVTPIHSSSSQRDAPAGFERG
jgi:hypothetical protein